MKYITTVLTIALSLCLSGVSYAKKKNKQPAYDGPITLIVVAGQSNAAGHGKYDEVGELATPPANLVNNKGQKTGWPGKKSFGPEVGFIHHVTKERPDEKFMLIKRASGGTSLYGVWAPEWTKEKADATRNGTKGKGFLPLVNNVKSILEKNPNVKLGGFLWMQGERDAAYKVSAESYEQNLIDFMQKFRTMVGVPAEDAPFVYGLINPANGRYKYLEVVQAAQKSAQTKIPNSKMVDSEGLGKPKTDPVHYNSEGQLELGKRMAVAWLEMKK